MKKKVILIINTGTPDRPDIKHVRRFLSGFLNDYRIIDLPYLLRKFLVNMVIVPFRSPKSIKLYRKLWTPEGSPLLVHMESLLLKLRSRLEGKYIIYGAMRYGNPSLKEMMKKIKSESTDEITIFPLYPQYASSTTGSVYEFIMKEIQTWNIIPEIRFIGQFYSHPSFIGAFANQVKQYDLESYDHVLFSYHGLPLRHIQKAHPENDSRGCDCHNRLPEHGTYCYKATCYETTRLLAEKLILNPESYSTSFQSRLSKNWLTPFTDMTLKELIQKGKKRVLVVAPSFVADCLETIIEIKDEYHDLFKQEGGDELVIVVSLNDNDEWVEAIISIANL